MIILKNSNLNFILKTKTAFITVDKRYSNPIKRKRQFDDDLYNGQGNNNEQDNQNIG